eukprot:1913761-Prymnesium_polylepis.1
MILSEKVSPERKKVQQFMQLGLDRDRQAEGLGRVVRDLYATIAPPPDAAHTDGTGSQSPPRKESRKEPAPKARSRSKEPPKAAAAKHVGARSRRRVSRSSSESEDDSDSDESSASDESRPDEPRQARKKAEERGRSEERKPVKYSKRLCYLQAQKQSPSPSRSIASLPSDACAGHSDSDHSRGGSSVGPRVRSRTPPRKAKRSDARDS